ncbi:MAG TPA: ABC transporter permease [Actinomycetota bacterium]|nr:ABC transporter permease [Actinomycetota bacterium]
MATESLGPPIAVARTRPAWLETFVGQFLALLASFGIALLLGSLLILAYGEKPIEVYRSIFDASLGSADGMGYVLSIATPLIFSALAVSVCFKGGLFNIGVEGQYLVAMLTAAVAELNLGFLPGFLLVPAVLIAAMLGGMIWAAIPGILKVKRGAHEVVTTIMLNWIAISLVGWALNGPIHYNDAPEGAFVDLRTNVFPESGLVGDLGSVFGITPGAHLSWLLFLAIAAAIVVWFLIRRTRLGYEARAVGSSPGSAKVGGVSIGATQLRLFLISGALAGLIGMQMILADRGYLPLNYVPFLGFLGIGVAFLGQNNPIGIIFAAILWGILSRGEVALQISSEVPREFIIILQGLLILSVVITYQIAKRRLAARRLQRAGEAGSLEDSAAPDESSGPRGPEATGTEALEPVDERRI